MNFKDIDLDAEMLKVMKVTTHHQDGISWKTLSVTRRFSSKGDSYVTGELATHWNPSKSIEHAMDIITQLRDDGAVDLAMGWDYSDQSWYARVEGEEANTSTSLPMAICTAVYKVIQKYPTQFGGKRE